MKNTHQDDAAPSFITIGNGASVHVAYLFDGDLCGSLCDPYVYSKSARMTRVSGPATCSRCAKASKRAAQQMRAGVQS